MVGHWDDATAEVIDRGPLRGTRQRLGPVAGCVRLGLSRYRLGPGERAMPVHLHSGDEELFVVLDGYGAVIGLWLLGYSNRVLNDICFYLRSQMAGLRGLGAYFRVEPVDYWDAEGAF